MTNDEMQDRAYKFMVNETQTLAGVGELNGLTMQEMVETVENSVISGTKIVIHEAEMQRAEEVIQEQEDLLRGLQLLLKREKVDAVLEGLKQ